MDPPVEPPHVRVAIVGSGFAGLGMAIRLLQEGERDLVVLERGDDVGGVWRDNTYPGAACDIESHLYSLSFAPEPGWSRAFAGHREILEYLRSCVERFGLRPHLRLRHEVLDATWSEEAQRWHLRTSAGPLTADVLVAAPGGLSEPAVPALPGLGSFEGRAFHSARWDHALSLRGKRVAVVGTGASAIQFVPAIQPDVARLTLFQRTPAWVVPRADRAFRGWEKRLFATVPLVERALRGGIYLRHEVQALMFFDVRIARVVEMLARRHLRLQVGDPVLRAKLTPDYRIGCKRILISNDYFPALTKPNVDVVTEGITEVRARTVVDGTGREHEVDAIVLGTGFQVQDFAFARRVRRGDGRTLHDAWGGKMVAHLGTTVSGFPNLFLLQGPNTGLGHNSVLVMIEAQIEHVVGALRHLRAHGASSVEPTARAQEAFVAEVDAKMRGTVWTSGGCRSWYLDANGRNSTLWPGFTFTFMRRVRRFDPTEYLVRGPRRETAAASGTCDAGPGTREVLPWRELSGSPSTKPISID